MQQALTAEPSPPIRREAASRSTPNAVDWCWVMAPPRWCSDQRSRARPRRDIHAELIGYGNASDASSISKPHADGQVRAMRQALAEARLAPDAITYLNAHGTATPVGDIVETQAIRTVFGASADTLCVSSTKALHGHLMGAAGALELLISILALEHDVIPPTAHLDHPDPQCDLDYVANVARGMPVQAVMSNSFGFGGTNVALVATQFRP